MNKKAYTAPKLIVLGNVAELTKGSKGTWTGLDIVVSYSVAPDDPEIFGS
ncbi:MULTISPECIES: lasso RiPP family leader peptide-containing protein [unclassified Dehalobacter]|nr:MULTISPECIES: lasso RiPP family leader peptide-containing protein [unclassified Dehalobacter]MCG1024348.1 lasso RiPP family leader peptide-containing protein [Dehalobacter sp.]